MRKLTLVLFLLFISFTTISAQCSDAGVCSIGGHALEEKSNPFNISLGYSYGYSGKEDDISYSSIKLRGAYNFYENAKLYFELPFNIQSGPLYDVHGIGDLVFNLSYGFNIDESQLLVSAGMRAATASENKNYVPQPYKSGLGTNDILFAVDYSFSNFLIGVGYQIAGKRGDEREDILTVERGNDLLLRSGYHFIFDKFSISPQLLFIKRLGKSNALVSTGPDASSIISFEKVDGTDQSQLNLLVNATYNINDSYSHFIEIAVPFLERDVNIDGLKRTFTISTGLSFGM